MEGFYRLSIVTLTQHLQAPAIVNEEGTMKDLARVRRRGEKRRGGGRNELNARAW